MPRTPEQYEEIRNEKRQKIMDAALELFANEGYHATSISKIAEKANISKGLMYNYFSGKEDLIKEIFNSISEEIIEMMNPDHDDEITLDEADQFFDLYFIMIKEKREQQKLLFQLSLQPQVLEYINHSDVSEKAIKNQQLLFGFLAKYHEDPQSVIIMLTSILKGFTMQYVFAPEHFSDEVLLDFKNHLKKTFIKK